MKHTIKNKHNQDGFTHPILLIIMAIIVVSFIGFAAYRTYKSVYKTIAYTGVFKKQDCTANTNSCSKYVLITNSNKKYNLNIPSTVTPVASGTPVKVTGTSVASSQNNIAVTKITPSSSGSIAPEPRPIVTYSGNLSIVGTESCRSNAVCSNYIVLQVSVGEEYILKMDSQLQQQANSLMGDQVTVSGNPDLTDPSGTIDVLSISPQTVSYKGTIQTISVACKYGVTSGCGINYYLHATNGTEYTLIFSSSYNTSSVPINVSVTVTGNPRTYPSTTLDVTSVTQN